MSGNEKAIYAAPYLTVPEGGGKKKVWIEHIEEGMVLSDLFDVEWNLAYGEVTFIFHAAGDCYV